MHPLSSEKVELVLTKDIARHPCTHAFVLSALPPRVATPALHSRACCLLLGGPDDFPWLGSQEGAKLVKTKDQKRLSSARAEDPFAHLRAPPPAMVLEDDVRGVLSQHNTLAPVAGDTRLWRPIQIVDALHTGQRAAHAAGAESAEGRRIRKAAATRVAEVLRDAHKRGKRWLVRVLRPGQHCAWRHRDLVRARAPFAARAQPGDRATAVVVPLRVKRLGMRLTCSCAAAGPRARRAAAPPRAPTPCGRASGAYVSTQWLPCGGLSQKRV